MDCKNEDEKRTYVHAGAHDAHLTFYSRVEKCNFCLQVRVCVCDGACTGRRLICGGQFLEVKDARVVAQNRLRGEKNGPGSFEQPLSRARRCAAAFFKTFWS